MNYGVDRLRPEFIDPCRSSHEQPGTCLPHASLVQNSQQLRFLGESNIPENRGPFSSAVIIINCTDGIDAGCHLSQRTDHHAASGGVHRYCAAVSGRFHALDS